MDDDESDSQNFAPYLAEEYVEEVIEIEENADTDSNGGDDLSDEEVKDANVSERDDSRVAFKCHKKSVLCCAVNATDSMAVSGSEDEMAFVWNTTDGTVVMECGGHKDSVVCVAFSSCGRYIATGDMSGLIIVWNASDALKVSEFDVNELNWLLWHEKFDVLMAGTAGGDAWLWKMSDTRFCKTIAGFGDANTAAKFIDDNRAVMGYDNGSLKIWDIKANTCVANISGFNAHKSSVTSIDCTSDGALIASGSVDCTAKLINTKTGKVLTTLECGERTDESADDEKSDSVESVSFCISQPLLATGTVEGFIEIWDINNYVKRHSIRQNDGISRLLWDLNNRFLLYTAGLDGVLRVYDGRSGQLVANKSGHRDQILDCCVSHNSSFIITASEDSTCRVFSLEV